jgi:hypothetical protein
MSLVIVAVRVSSGRRRRLRDAEIEHLEEAWAGHASSINYVDQIYQASRSTNQSAPAFVGQVFSLDQTATVRNWVSGLYANNGLAMGLVDERLLAAQPSSGTAKPSGTAPKK